MLKKHLFIFCLLSFGWLEAQTQIDRLITKGDSLVAAKNYEKSFSVYQKALVITKEMKNGEKEAQLFKKIGVFYYRKKQYQEAQEYYQKSFRIDSTSKTAADAYYNTSLVKRKLNQVDSILPYLEKSMVLYRTLDQDESSYNAYLTAGIIYKNRQLYDTALEYLLKANEGFETLNSIKKQASVARTIGNIHNRLRNFEQGLIYHLKSLELTKKSDDRQRIGLSYLGVGSAYKNLSKIDSALSNYKKVLKFFVPDKKEYSVAIQSIAEIFKDQKLPIQSEKYYLLSIDFKRKVNDTNSLLYAYNGLIDLYLNNDRIGEGYLYLDTIANIIPKVKDNFIVLDYLGNQVNYQKAIRNYKLAYTFQAQYTELFKKLYDVEKTGVVQQIQSRYEYQKKVNENLQLSLANQNNLLLIEKQKNTLQRTYWILFLLALLLTATGIGYYLFTQRQKVKNQYVRIEKLEAIYTGQETIKKRIARDLHDIITTNFDGLRLKVLTLPRIKNPEKLSEGIAHDLKSINQQIRQVSHRLSPLEMHVKERPFTEIIKSQLTEFQLYRKIFVTLEHELPMILNALDFENQNHVYSILLEALNNIEKHAHATEVEVSFYEDADEILHLMVTDNGIGIVAFDTPGIGLMNIKQRAELLGGLSTVEKIATGTKVHLSFPIKT